MHSQDGNFSQLFSDAAYRYAQSFGHLGKPEAANSKNNRYVSVLSPRLFQSLKFRPLPRAKDLRVALNNAKASDARLHAAVEALVESAHLYAQRTAADRGVLLAVQHTAHVKVPSKDFDVQKGPDLVREVRAAARAHQSALTKVLIVAAPQGKGVSQRVVGVLSGFCQKRRSEALKMCKAEMALAAACCEDREVMDITELAPPGDERTKDYVGKDPSELQRQGRPSEVLMGRWNGFEEHLMSFCLAAVHREAALTARERASTAESPFGFNAEETNNVLKSLDLRARSAESALVRAHVLAPLPTQVEAITIAPQPFRAGTNFTVAEPKPVYSGGLGLSL